ncbi:MAG: hypothetical protein ACYC21_03025 [Eubacteriales bacterium]
MVTLKKWAQTYGYTNNLINEICRGLSEILASLGVQKKIAP